MADISRIDELRTRLGKEPGSRLFAQLAEELRKSGEFGEAIDVCRAGLEKNPSYASARMTLGRALQDSGDLPGAIPEFELVLKSAPDNILASRMLAECLEGTGDLAGAAKRYRATLVLAAGDKQIQARLDEVEAKLKGPAPVVASAPQPAPAPPEEPDAATVRARALAADAPIPLVDAEESFELETPYGASGFPTEPMHAPPSAVPPSAVPATGPVGGSADFEFDPGPEFPAVVEPPAPTPPPEEPPTPVATALPGPIEDPPAPEPPEPRAEPAPEPEPAPELASSTLAELYFNQGHTEKAIEVYEQLLEREPANERARARLIEVKALESHLKAEEQRAAAPPASDPRAARRAAIERTIARLEALLAATRRE